MGCRHGLRLMENHVKCDATDWQKQLFLLLIAALRLQSVCVCVWVLSPQRISTNFSHFMRWTDGGSSASSASHKRVKGMCGDCKHPLCCWLLCAQGTQCVDDWRSNSENHLFHERGERTVHRWIECYARSTWIMQKSTKKHRVEITQPLAAPH